MWDGGIPRPPAGGRGPLRRFAPCVLRWKTLRVSSAPHPGGFESLRLALLSRVLECEGPIVVMGRRDSASAFSAAAARCVASLLACCAGKRFAFPQLRTLAGSNPSACPRKSAPGPYGPGALCSKGLGRRDSNPQQPAPKTGVLPLNYVPMCGVAQKQLV